MVRWYSSRASIGMQTARGWFKIRASSELGSVRKTSSGFCSGSSDCRDPFLCEQRLVSCSESTGEREELSNITIPMLPTEVVICCNIWAYSFIWAVERLVLS